MKLGKMNRRRKRLFKEQRGRCHYCLQETKPKDFTVDHIHPKSKGGSYHRRNIVGACSPCNAEKADMSYEQYFALKFHQATGVVFKGSLRNWSSV